MDPFQAAIILIIVLFAVLATGMPVGFAIGLVSFGGIVVLMGPSAAVEVVSNWTRGVLTNFLYLSLPFFILMGELAILSGAVGSMFEVARGWFGRLPAGLPITTIAACALFGTVSGSGMAATAVVGRMAYPELMAMGYSRRITAGVIVSAGGLAVLIPPSLIAIVYAGLAETSVAAQLMAGVIPGLILAAAFVVVVVMWCSRWGGNIAPSPPGVSWRKRVAATANLVPIALIALAVFLAIYLGIATPSESAGVGAAAALFLCIARGRATWPELRKALVFTGQTSGFLMLIVLTGTLLSFFLTYLKIPAMVSSWVIDLPLSPVAIIIVMLAMYLILGCFLDGVSMLVLTLPVLVPIVDQLGFSLVWFGVLYVMTLEVSVITPPVGFHLYVMQGISDIGIGDIVMGALPFFVADFVVIALLLAFPQLALWLT
ncbi:MAG: TRAP transporter large permease [Chloroflexi bacterium]|nr:TRAP transporter large permease [Chloroflexota bacterium]